MDDPRGAFISVDSTDRLREVVRAAAAHRRGIVPTGSPARPEPLPGDEDRVVVSLAPMDRVLRHEVEDLTVRCEAGCRVADLAAALAPHGQRVAMEPPGRAGATVGAVLADRRDGFVRAAFGPVRDQVLGMTVMLASGECAKTGGQVVKNVTGYELAKLYTGSGGSLGIVTEVTLRVRAAPAATATLVVPCDTPSEAVAAALALRDLPCQLSGLAIAGGQAAVWGEGPWKVAVRAEACERALEDGARAAREIAGRAVEVVDAPAHDELWRLLSTFPSTQGFWTRLRLRPSFLADALTRLIRASEADRFGAVVDVASATLDFTLPSVVRDVDTTVGQLMLGRVTRDAGGFGSVPSDPLDRVERFNRFGGPSPAERGLVDRIKQALDPDGLMAQGRLPTGMV